MWQLSQPSFDYSPDRPRGRNFCCEGKGCPPLRSLCAIGSPVRIEIDFISSMIEIPRSRPRNADRTKHGGEGETERGRDRSDITDGAERCGVGATRDESDALLLLRVWADVSGNPITAAANGREDAQRRWPRWQRQRCAEIKTAQSRRLIRRFEPGSCLARRFSLIINHCKSGQPHRIHLARSPS